MPEDRDVVMVVQEFLRARHECGRWEWEYEDFDEFDLDYTVCPFCRDVGEFADTIRDNRKHMYGVSYSYYPRGDHAD